MDDLLAARSPGVYGVHLSVQRGPDSTEMKKPQDCCATDPSNFGNFSQSFRSFCYFQIKDPAIFIHFLENHLGILRCFIASRVINVPPGSSSEKSFIQDLSWEGTISACHKPVVSPYTKVILHKYM